MPDRRAANDNEAGQGGAGAPLPREGLKQKLLDQISENLALERMKNTPLNLGMEPELKLVPGSSDDQEPPRGAG